MSSLDLDLLKNTLKHSRFALNTCTSKHKFYQLISPAVDLLNMMTVVVGNKEVCFDGSNLKTYL